MNKTNGIVIALLIVLIALVAYVALKPKSSIDVSSLITPSDQTATVNNQKGNDYQPNTQKPISQNNVSTVPKLVYKQQDDTNVPVKFSYPNNWTVKTTVSGRYNEVSYTVQPNTGNPNDSIILDLSGSTNACYSFDEPGSSIYTSSRAYLFNLFNIYDGIYFNKQNIKAVGEFVGRGDCVSIYTKSTDQSVLTQFDKIVQSLKSKV